MRWWKVAIGSVLLLFPLLLDGCGSTDPASTWAVMNATNVQGSNATTRRGAGTNNGTSNGTNNGGTNGGGMGGMHH